MNIRNIFLAIFMVIIWISVSSAEIKRQSYVNWLQKHNAWEILNNKLESLSPTPENVLTRANYFLRMSKFQKSLNILNKYEKFSNSTLEANRLLLKAKIYRKQRHHYLALENFSHLTKFLTPDDYREKLNNEPNIKWYIKTVSTKRFWEKYSGGPANKNLDNWFLNILNFAPEVWPESTFWQQVDYEVNQNKKDVDSVLCSSENCLSISKSTRNKTVQALLSAATGDMSKGRKLLMSVQLDEVRLMWSQIFSGVFDRDFVSDMDKNGSKHDLRTVYPKYRAFEDYIYPLLKKQSSRDWMIRQPNTPSWINFRSRISSLEPEIALNKIRQELTSSLLNKNLEKVLKKYAFINAVLAGKYSESEIFWEKIESENKCLSLDLAGYVLGFSSSFRREKDKNKSNHPHLNQSGIIFKNSLETHSVSNLHTPFWIKEFKDNYSKVSKNFSLDFLANYSLHKQKWSKNHSSRLAKTISLLYSSSLLQNKACMWLAKKAHQNKHRDKAWGYLQEIDNNIQNENIQKDYLQAKAGLLMEQGRKKESLKVYKKLLANYPQNVPAEKKLNLAILSQRQGNWDWAEKTLLDLWENRQGMSSRLKAETLFWLGESAEHKGLGQKAKDYYFRLAWKYPKENMWAVTALHRAALICKNQGQFFTAKSILEKVKKEAEQESQKKQAEDALSRIEKKLQQKDTSTQFLLY